MLEKINLIYKESDNQSGLFTSYHTRFDCMIKYDGKQFSFPYQCNTDHTEPNLKDIMDCLLLDMGCYENSKDFTDFCNELGLDCYDKESKRSYNACKRTSKAINRMFSNDEISRLFDEINE